MRKKDGSQRLTADFAVFFCKVYKASAECGGFFVIYGKMFSFVFCLSESGSMPRRLLQELSRHG